MSEAALHRAMQALAEVSDQLVLVGGTAQRLFPLHPLGRDPGFDLLSTEDVDLAAPLAIRVPADTDLLERLREAGFEAKVSGADRAKWTYPLRDGDAPITLIDGERLIDLMLENDIGDTKHRVELLEIEPSAFAPPLDDNDQTA